MPQGLVACLKFMEAGFVLWEKRWVKRTKYFMKNFFIFIVSMVAIIGTFEMATRLFAERPQTVQIENARRKDAPRSQLASIIENARIEDLYVTTATGERLKPNMRAVMKNHYLSKRDIEIVTNSLGYRDVELGEKAGDEVRILALGDSITLGDYVTFDETYTQQIERYFLENPNLWFPMSAQVINAGVGGIDLETEFAILMETGLLVRPDVVLVGLYLNDVMDSPQIYLIKGPALLQKSRFFQYLLGKVNIVRALRQYDKFLEEAKPKQWSNEAEKFLASRKISQSSWKDDQGGFNQLIYDSFRDWGYAWSDDFWTKIELIMTLMSETSKDHGFKLAVVLFPVRYQVESEILEDEPQRRFEQMMNRMNIPHFDLLPALRTKFTKDQVNIFYDHVHYIPEGNQFIGREIGRFLLPFLRRDR